MGKSSGTNSTVTQTTAPNPQFQAAYQGAVNNAQNLAAQPYQQYQGSLLAPLQPYQNAAIGEIAGSQGIEQPLLNAAATDFSNASTPITATPFSASAVNQYLSPYTQDVTSSLQNLFNQQNATQQSQVTGNAAAEGAFGGDRSAVAAALTAGQQQAQEAPVLAQNLQSGYNTALGEFNAQQQANLQAQQATGWLEQGAGYGNANLGQEAQNTYLTGANALLNAGGLQQQQAQEGLNIPYEQFIAQESYPYQMAGWEANIAEGLGGASGGTSSTQYPGPSALSQAAGLGLTGTGLLGATGAFGNSGYLTGDTGLLSGILGTGAGIGAPLEAGAEGAFGGADIGSLLGDAAGAALVRRGGRIPRQGGGSLTTPYNTGMQLPGMANPTTGAPQLPNLATGYLPTPPPAPGTRTMPTGAGLGGGMQNQQQPVQQALQTLQQLKAIKGLFTGDSASTPAASMGGAVTLATPYQGFDDGGAPVLQAGQAATGGASPLSQGMIQQYLQLPMEQLQELAQRAPPQTPQGQAIQRALQMKKMNPGSAIGGAGAPTPPMSPQGMGVTPAPVGPATSALSPTLAAAWKGGRIGRDSGGDIPGLAVSPDSPLLTSPLSGTGEPSLAAPDLGVPGVSLATGPNANVVTQEGNAPPQQKPVSPALTSGSGSSASPSGGNKYDDYLRAHGETPQGGSGATSPSLANPPSKTDAHTPPSDDPLAGVMSHIAQPESGGRNVLYGGAPVPPGNVIPGAIGPTGQQTHAFSKYQFEPGTWNDANTAAKAQGRAPLDKDNPQDVEWAGRYTARNTYGIDQNGRNLDQAAAAGAVDYSRLAKTWPSLAPHTSGGTSKPSLATGPSASPGNPVFMGQVTDTGSANTGDSNIQQALALLRQQNQTPQGQFYNSPWMPLVAAGAGMLASRSPFPGVALGEGLETGLKELGGQQAAIPENELKQMQATVGGVPLLKALGGQQVVDELHNQGADGAAATATAPSSVGATSGQGNAPVGAGSVGSAAGPAAAGISGAGQPTVPASGGQNLTPEQQAAVGQVREQIRQLGVQRDFAQKWGDTATAINASNKIAELSAGLPEYKGAQATTEGYAQVGPAAEKAGAIKQAELPFTSWDIRPGGVHGIGMNPVYAAPNVRSWIDAAGTKHEEYMQPPIGGQTAPGTPPGQGAVPGQSAATPPSGNASSQNGQGGSGQGIGASWTTELSPHDKEALEARAKDEQEGRDATLKDSQAARYQQATLNVMSQNAKDMYTGPGADYVGDFNRVARLVDPSYNDTVAARESFTKNGGALVRQATRELSPRAAFQEVQFINSTLPNQDMSPQGLHAVIGELQGVNDYKIAKAVAQNQWEHTHGGTGHVEDFENTWQSTAPVTPYTFIVARMAQPERQQMFRTWMQTPEGRAQIDQLDAETQRAVANGWMHQ